MESIVTHHLNKMTYTLESALAGSTAPLEILQCLTLVDIPYIGFDDSEHVGQLIVHYEVAGEVKEIFKELYAVRFPIARMVPIAAYNWDDNASMEDNNCSGFNHRRIIATDMLSNHSLGRAIDINPVQNPYFAANGKVYPIGAQYEPNQPGTLYPESIVVKLFKERGWRWLGEREECTDYQHFDKIGLV